MGLVRKKKEGRLVEVKNGRYRSQDSQKFIALNPTNSPKKQR